LGDRFWLTKPSVLDKEATQIADVGKMWADEKSREVYSAILASRHSGKIEDMPRPSRDQIQYFPFDIKGWLPDQPLRFVDCGAYDGDTLRAISALRLRVEAYAAFEPDMDNFKKLCVAWREMLDPGTSVHLWPCGVSSHAEHVAFASGMGEASHLSVGGAGMAVPCVGLDQVLGGFHPNMVKMDIEGAEPSAVAGASRLIVENCPRLAISLYHCPDHLWVLPLAIAALHSGYKMYLRVYGYNLFDVVLYAVPEPLLT
jgi:FkbM family methyltransferase